MLLLGISLFLALGFTADITGKWVAQTQNRNGGTGTVTFDLKYDGTSLTGTVTSRGGGRGGRRGGGGAATPTPVQISDAKFDGSNVTFSVKREFNGQTMVTTYSGTFNGDDLKLKETRQGRNGEQTSDIAAKRATS
jgi:hypothetical protein